MLSSYWFRQKNKITYVKYQTTATVCNNTFVGHTNVNMSAVMDKQHKATLATKFWHEIRQRQHIRGLCWYKRQSCLVCSVLQSESVQFCHKPIKMLTAVTSFCIFLSIYKSGTRGLSEPSSGSTQQVCVLSDEVVREPEHKDRLCCCYSHGEVHPQLVPGSSHQLALRRRFR